MKVLVLGGTGMVGSQVVAELAERKAEVHVLTRNAEKAAAPEDIEHLSKLLGHPPRRFEDYARETAAAWKTSA